MRSMENSDLLNDLLVSGTYSREFYIMHKQILYC